jgi:galactonate dehydratase
MRITAIETIQVAEFGNMVWVEVGTDEGLVGLGETFRNPEATVAYIHETAVWYREAFGRGAIDVAHFDMGWVGGLSEGRKVAALAEAFDRPIAPHDCVGPVLLCANLHLLTAVPNALLLETVRAHHRGYYQQLVTELPRIECGFAYPMTAPGLGTALHPDLKRRPDARVRRTAG